MPRKRLLIAMLLAAVSSSARGDFAEYRSIFVDRFDYPYSTGNIPAMTSAIELIMQNAQDQGFTEVIWQVRGRADALYNSNFEPPISQLTPGFDPLQTAIDAAHARGLKIHAWMNATPMWNTTALNPPANHIFNTQPNLRLMDLNGVLEPQQGWSNYSTANPVLPEMHAHLNNVVNDIAANYAVDGIHLDYIRYLPGTLNFSRLPHDPASHQMFFEATGLDGANSANNTAYKSFIAGRITELVRSIKQTVDAAEVSTGRPMELTASVWRDPDVGKNDYMQDYRTWLQQDLLDVAMPMIYLSASNDATYFNANLQNTLAIQTNARVSPTLATYLHVAPGGGGVALTLSEMLRAYDFGADGVGFYDYPAFFNTQTTSDRAAIKNFFDTLVPPPPPPPPGVGNVLDNFEVDEGHFRWVYNTSPASQTFGLAAATTIERVTNDAQTGAGSQLIDLVSDGGATWQLRHNSGLTVAAQPSGNVPLPATGYVGVWLRTDDAGITVRLGLDDPVSGNTALERGIAQAVIADDQWHLYQWDLENDAQWQAFAGGANSAIDAANGTVTIDSLWFAGAGNAQIYLDNVSHNPDGSLLSAPIAGDFNGDGNVNASDLANWRTGAGIATGAATAADGDADGDGDVDGGDLMLWQRASRGPATAAAAATATVPEPTAAWLAAFMALLLLMFAVRESRRC